MSLTYQVTLSRDSIKFLKKQEKAVQIRIAKAIKGLIIQPPMGDIQPLKVTILRFVMVFFYGCLF